MAGGYGRGQRANSDSGSLVHKCRKGDEPIEETERGLAAGGAGASMEDRTDGHAMQEEREEGSLNISARSKLQLSPKRGRGHIRLPRESSLVGVAAAGNGLS